MTLSPHEEVLLLEVGDLKKTLREEADIKRLLQGSLATRYADIAALEARCAQAEEKAENYSAAFTAQKETTADLTQQLDAMRAERDAARDLVDTVPPDHRSHCRVVKSQIPKFEESYGEMLDRTRSEPEPICTCGLDEKLNAYMAARTTPPASATKEGA